MLIRHPDTLIPSHCPGTMSRASRRVSQITWFEVYRNGVLDHVVNGTEGVLRNRMSTLYNLHPDDSWDYAPVGPRWGASHL